MASLKDLIQAAEEVNEESRAEKHRREREEAKGAYKTSDPELFPKPPEGKTEEIRQKMREQCLTDLYYLCKVVLGYTKLRVHPHGEMCAMADFLEQKREEGDFRFNRSAFYAPRDHYKTTIWTIARAVQRGLRDPNTRGLIVAGTGTNASRFGTEISNQFKFNTLLQWLFPEVIPDNFNTATWNSNEMVLKRTAPWREPTYDMMGAMGAIESRHYDWIIPDDLVHEKHIHSDVEMDKLIDWIPGLEPLLVNDVESFIDFVGSRKKKGDAYEFVEKYYGAGEREAVPIGPHAEMRGAITIYTRSIIEDGKLIFPYDKKLKSGVSMAYVTRIRTHDPERYWAQLANSPKGLGISWFELNDLRFFTLSPNGLIEAVYDGKLVEKVSAWGLQRIILYDPSVAERKGSSKQAIHVVAKGSGPNRYCLESHVGHIAPDEAIELLFELDKKWQPEFVSIEKRGFQGWVKYNLNMISELKGLPYIPVVEFPPEGSVRAMWSKTEHIRALQPLVKNHLMWLQDDQFDLIEGFEFYPHVRWDDALDGLAQGLEYWPFTVDEAEFAATRERESLFLRSSLPFGTDSARDERRPFNEAEFLAQFDATGYGFRRN